MDRSHLALGLALAVLGIPVALLIAGSQPSEGLSHSDIHQLTASVADTAAVAATGHPSPVSTIGFDPPPPPSAEATTIVEIFWEGGDPAASAEVRVFKDGICLGESLADDAGKASITTVSPPFVCVVWPEGSVPFGLEVTAPCDCLSVLVPIRSVVGGFIHARGPRPERPIPLRLASEDPEPLIAPLRDLLPASIVASDYGKAVRPLALPEDGRFRFRGLPETWSGALEAGDGASLLDDSQQIVSQLPLASPDSHLTFTALLWSRIDARLVIAASNDASREVSVNAEICIGERERFRTGVRSRADGSVSLLLPVMEASVLHLAVAVPGRIGRTLMDFTLSRAEHRDLGDLRVPTAKEPHIEVTSESGVPLPGASVALPRAGRRPVRSRDTTDLQGRAIVQVEATTEAVLLGKVGYATRRIAVSQAELQSIHVTLCKESTLILHTTGSPGSASDKEIMIRVTSREAPFDTPVAPIADASRSILEPRSFRRGPEGFVAMHSAAVGDELVLAGLRSGNELTIDILTGSGALCTPPMSIILGAAEHRTVDIVVQIPERQLVLVVEDERGMPVADATVAMGGPPRTCATITTDESGRATIADAGDFVDLTVSAPGYDDCVISNAPVPPDRHPLRVTLLPRSDRPGPRSQPTIENTVPPAETRPPPR